MSNQKTIEYIIKDLIDKTLELNKRPLEIILTQEHYDELCTKVFKQSHADRGEYYEVIPDGVVYHEKRLIPRISKYEGLDIRVGAETRIKFY